MTKQAMNDIIIICSFIIDAQNEDRGNFETSSLNNFFSVIKAYLSEDPGRNLKLDHEFRGAKDVKNAKLSF